MGSKMTIGCLGKSRCGLAKRPINFENIATGLFFSSNRNSIYGVITSILNKQLVCNLA